MSKARYITALSLGGVAVILMAVMSGNTFSFFESLLVGIGLGIMLAELIFWRDSLAVRIFLFFVHIIKVIFLFWISLFATGNLIFIIIALLIASPVFALLGGIFSVGLTVYFWLALILFIPHLFSFGRDLY